MESEIQNSIYNLQLNESTTIESNHHGSTDVRRVPGGWIYSTISYKKKGFSARGEMEGYAITSVFVPYFDNKCDNVSKYNDPNNKIFI